MGFQPENNSEASRSIDEQLLPYLNSAGNADDQEQLHRLLEVARPIVYRIVRSMRVGLSATHPPAELTTQDIFGEVCVRLLKNLRALKRNPHENAISNFAGLVATTTSTVLSDHLRGKQRQRKNLREKLLRLFATNSKLSTWKDYQDNVICGYAAWRPRRDTIATSLRHHSQLDLNFGVSQLDDLRNKNTAELTLLVLDNLGRPVKFEDLVDLVNIAAQGVQVQTISIDQKHYVQASPLVISPPDFAATIDNHRLLQRLFGEIQKLNIEQRKSLLLNMTDCYGYGIEWFLFSKIASEEHLANLLQLSVSDFRRLLAELPLSDEAISRELGISPAKVMNMRRAVRERLNRRRRDFFSGRNSDPMRMK
jgi:DNA-directed RNA polymerase specialized sigma24 family protein